jgi:hypothetical protein
LNLAAGLSEQNRVVVVVIVVVLAGTMRFRHEHFDVMDDPRRYDNLDYDNDNDRDGNGAGGSRL